MLVSGNLKVKLLATPMNFIGILNQDKHKHTGVLINQKHSTYNWTSKLATIDFYIAILKFATYV